MNIVKYIKQLFKKKQKSVSIKYDSSVPHANIKARDFIQGIEAKIRKTPGSFTGDYFPLKHTFADGIYVREISIPKHFLIVGKIHKHCHPNFLLKGDVTVLTEEGVKRIQAPCSMISPAGTKRLLFTHEDTVWTTVHSTNETDLEKIEEQIIAKSYEQLDSKTMNIEIENFVNQISMTEEMA